MPSPLSEHYRKQHDDRFRPQADIDQRQNQAQPRNRLGLNKLSGLFTD